jgi:hypothetical protein
LISTLYRSAVMGSMDDEKPVCPECGAEDGQELRRRSKYEFGPMIHVPDMDTTPAPIAVVRGYQFGMCGHRYSKRYTI